MQPSAILLAVRDPEESDRLARVLRCDGHRVIPLSPAEAPPSAETEDSIELLLVDVAGPAPGAALGWAADCSQRWPGVGLILIASMEADEAGSLALRFGFDDCLVRPFGDVELLAAVHYVLHLVSTRRAQADRLRHVEERLSSWETTGGGRPASRERVEGARSLARLLRADIEGMASAAAASFKSLLADADDRTDLQSHARALLTHLNTLYRLARRLEALSPEAPTVRQPVSVSGVVRQAAALFEDTWRESGLALRVEMPNKLPRIVGDRDRILQLFVNLLANAGEAAVAQATPGSEPAGGSVAVLGRAEDRRVVVEVLDSGPGMPEWAVRRAFDPFFAPTPERRSVGLGLFCCREIVQEHNGSIELASSPEGGTRVTVAFPRPAPFLLVG